MSLKIQNNMVICSYSRQKWCNLINIKDYLIQSVFLVTPPIIKMNTRPLWELTDCFYSSMFSGLH